MGAAIRTSGRYLIEVYPDVVTTSDFRHIDFGREVDVDMRRIYEGRPPSLRELLTDVKDPDSHVNKVCSPSTHGSSDVDFALEGT